MNNYDNNKKERQLDNLTNLVENHTRTQRHLEQYSEIGDRGNKEHAREIQKVRENEMENLKKNIIDEGNETINEQLNNVIENYKSAERYMEDNYEKIPEDRWNDMVRRQNNRKEQAGNLVDKIDFDE